MKLVLCSEGFHTPNTVEACVKLVGKPQDQISIGIINEAYAVEEGDKRWVLDNHSQGYTLRKKGKKPQSYKWDKDAVSKLLRDTTYTGVLRYGKTFVDLTEWYDFEPIVSVDDFMKINKISDLGDPKVVSSLMVKPRESVKANLLRGLVFCGYCNRSFTSSITSKKLKDGTKRYYYYKCETDGCEFKNKSVRANVVIDEAIEFLDTHLFTTENNYDHYVTEAKEYAATQAKVLDSDIAALARQVGNKQNEYDRTKAAVRDNPAIARHYNLDEVETELHALQADLDKLSATRKRLKQSILTYSQYLELFENIGVSVRKTHDMELLDETLRKFFSNFTIKTSGVGKQQRSTVSYKLKEPWAGFIISHDFDRGREKPTLLELFDYIIYEPEMSAELMRDLQEIFSPSNKIKLASLRAR